MINKLSFGKLFGKKENVEKPKEEQVPSYRGNEEKTTLEKIRGAAAARYLAIMMGVAGAGAMTSCSEATAIAEADNSAILKLLSQIAENQAKTNELLQQFMNQVDSSDKETRELIKQIMAQNNKITAILSGIASDVSQIKNAVFQIEQLMRESNQNDEEFLAKIDVIINNQGSDSDKLQQLIDLNNEQNNWLINISTLIGNLKGDNQELSDTIKAWFEQYKNDMGDFKNNDKDHTLLMQMIFKALQESNGISKDILAAIKDIQNSNMKDSEKLAQIIELLAGIDNKLGDILTEIRGIADKLDKLIDQNEQNNDQTVNILLDIAKNTGNIDAKLDQVIKNQEENNKLVLNINQNTDEILAQLKQINGKMITLEQLQDMLGPMFGDVIQELTIIGGNQISKDELEAILEKHKVDLTKTNSLIENLTAVVKNLNLSGFSPEDLKALTDAINDFKNEYKAGSTAQMQAYQDIMAEIAKLNGGLDAIAKAIKEAHADFKEFAGNAKTFGDAALEELRKIREGQSNQTAAMESYFQKAQDAMVQAQQARMEQIALLQALVDKETGGNGGLTKEELEDALSKLNINVPDYKDLLQEISDKIGKVITSDDLQNFFIKTQPDLTKTNALIETLIDVLKNKNFSITGDVNLNLSEIESQLSNLFNLIANGKSPSQDQINVLIQLVQQLVNSQGGGGDVAFRAPSRAGEQVLDFNDMYAQLAAKAASDVYNA